MKEYKVKILDTVFDDITVIVDKIIASKMIIN